MLFLCFFVFFECVSLHELSFKAITSKRCFHTNIKSRGPVETNLEQSKDQCPWWTTSYTIFRYGYRSIERFICIYIYIYIEFHASRSTSRSGGAWNVLFSKANRQRKTNDLGFICKPHSSVVHYKRDKHTHTHTRYVLSGNAFWLDKNHWHDATSSLRHEAWHGSTQRR